MPESPRITSRQNPRIAEAAKLRSRRGRDRQGRFLIDGARENLRAATAGIRIEEAFMCDDFCRSAECRKALAAIQSAGAELIQVSPEVYAKLAFGDREDGIVSVALPPTKNFSALQLPAHPTLAVLEALEKPGNVGAIFRSADAAGLDAVIVADPVTDLYNPHTIRASLGTVFRENVIQSTVEELLPWLEQQAISIIAARPNAEILYTEIDLSCGAAIVLGSEAEGLSDAWQRASVQPVRLPMHGLADSLNVSTTAAVLFYESLRQRSVTSTQ